MRYSSNIGLAKIALQTGSTIQMEYFKRLGLLDTLQIQLPEKGRSLKPRDNKPLTTVTLAYGYGISTTLLHVAQAFAAILSNNGCLMYATLIKSASKQKEECEQIINPQTKQIMQEIMRDIVKSGTGRKENTKGYNVGGKTGTGEKNKNGIYNKKLNVSTFIGAFPIQEPKYIVAIMVDEAKSQGFVPGGLVAAPVVKNVIEGIAPILGVTPS